MPTGLHGLTKSLTDFRKYLQDSGIDEAFIDRIGRAAETITSIQGLLETAVELISNVSLYGGAGLILGRTILSALLTSARSRHDAHLESLVLTQQQQLQVNLAQLRQSAAQTLLTQSLARNLSEEDADLVNQAVEEARTILHETQAISTQELIRLAEILSTDLLSAVQPSWIDRMVSQVGNGVADATYRPVLQILQHPLATTGQLCSAVIHPVRTVKAMAHHAHQEPVRFFTSLVTGYGVSRAIAGFSQAASTGTSTAVTAGTKVTQYIPKNAHALKVLEEAGKLNAAGVLKSTVSLAESISRQQGMLTINYPISELVQAQQTVQAAQVAGAASSAMQATAQASRWNAHSAFFSGTGGATSVANRRQADEQPRQRARATH